MEDTGNHWLQTLTKWKRIQRNKTIKNRWCNNETKKEKNNVRKTNQFNEIRIRWTKRGRDGDKVVPGEERARLGCCETLCSTLWCSLSSDSSSSSALLYLTLQYSLLLVCEHLCVSLCKCTCGWSRWERLLGIFPGNIWAYLWKRMCVLVLAWMSIWTATKT